MECTYCIFFYFYFTFRIPIQLSEQIELKWKGRSPLPLFNIPDVVFLSFLNTKECEKHLNVYFQDYFSAEFSCQLTGIWEVFRQVCRLLIELCQGFIFKGENNALVNSGTATLSSQLFFFFFAVDRSFYLWIKHYLWFGMNYFIFLDNFSGRKTTWICKHRK